jgi:hypothetical protein
LSSVKSPAPSGFVGTCGFGGALGKTGVGVGTATGATLATAGFATGFGAIGLAAGFATGARATGLTAAGFGRGAGFAALTGGFFLVFPLAPAMASLF